MSEPDQYFMGMTNIVRDVAAERDALRANLSKVMEENARLIATVAALKAADAERAAGLAKVQGYRADAEARVNELEEFAAFVLAADRESLANHRPKWGLADCVDNDGQPYQSQAFGDMLTRARSLLSREG